MRILFVNQHGGYFGGVEQHIAHVASALSRRGHVCDLACGPAAGSGNDTEFQSRFAGVSIVPALATGAPRDTSWLKALAASRRYDAIYLHKLPWLPDRPGGAVRLVRMIHDHDLTCPRRHKYFAHSGQICEHPAGWRCYLDAAFIQRDTRSPLGLRLDPIGPKLEDLARHHAVDALLVGSRWMAGQLTANGLPTSLIDIVPPAVPAPTSRLSAVPAAPNVLYAGQLVRGKGVDLLLTALAHVPCPWRLDVVGDGAQAGDLQRLARTLGLSDRVTFHGRLGPDDMARAYQNARLVAVPSRWPEPFGMVGIEAMHHGRAVVAFATGGIPDWLEDGRTGMLVPPQDIAGLAAAIGRVLIEPGLAERFGSAAHERVNARFGFDRCVDRIEDALSPRTPSLKDAA